MAVRTVMTNETLCISSKAWKIISQLNPDAAYTCFDWFSHYLEAGAVAGASRPRVADTSSTTRNILLSYDNHTRTSRAADGGTIVVCDAVRAVLSRVVSIAATCSNILAWLARLVAYARTPVVAHLFICDRTRVTRWTSVAVHTIGASMVGVGVGEIALTTSFGAIIVNFRPVIAVATAVSSLV